ncbi:MAG: hypothetical protein WA771_06755 [Chthoniobacterales bacterium]
MTDNPEIKSKILDWQRRFKIEDGDPAMALLELLEIYGQNPNPSPTESGPQTVQIEGFDEAIVEQVRSQLAPGIERLGFQTQELKQRLDAMNFEGFSEQVAGYHEGIDYCTKKLDVVKKESDSIVIQLNKVANSINPISRGAILVLILAACGLGYILGVMFS